MSSFDDFAISEKRGDGSLHKMLHMVQRMSNHVKAGTHRPFCLTLAGPSGVGKTHLARAFKNSLINCGFISWPSWCIQGFTEENIRYLRVYRFPLVIDEAFIATGGKSDIRTATQEARALVSVLEARAEMWTLLTTNASLAQIQEQDERLYSRIIRNGSFAIEVDKDTPDFATTAPVMGDGL